MSRHYLIRESEWLFLRRFDSGHPHDASMKRGTSVRLSEFHKIMCERGQLLPAKQGGNKGIKRRWREDRREYLERLDERSAQRLISEIFSKSETGDV